MSSILEKTRLINKLLQKAEGLSVNFNDMAVVLSRVIDANVYIIKNDGIILGHALAEGYACHVMDEVVLRDEKFPEAANQEMLQIMETEANKVFESNKCVFRDEVECIFNTQYVTVVPVIGGGERLGTLVLASFKDMFDDEDLVLSEYGATLVGMEILRTKAGEIEQEARKKASVEIVLGTLSYSELEAIDSIFRELAGTEGLLVASKIADQVGITRSVIVNALRKLESAGVIESRSLGMKGTFIKVINEKLLEELEKMKA
jgi:transcriptional pleiotropic repressor